MRRLREDPEVLVLALLVALFAGCLLTIHPRREVIDAALQTKAARDTERAAWLAKHPIWRGLRLGLTFDGNLKDVAWAEHRLLPVDLAYGPGRFGKGLRGGAGRRIQVEDFLIRPAATWAAWARIDPEAPADAAMTLLDSNGCVIMLSGGRLRAGVMDGQWKELSVDAPPPGHWFHVALTWGGGENGIVNLYVDGERAGSRAFAGRIAYPYRTLVIGAANDYSRAFAGRVDDVCIFDRDLGAPEVAALAWLGIERMRTTPATNVTAATLLDARMAWKSAETLADGVVATPPVRAPTADMVFQDLVLGFSFEDGLAGGPRNPPFEVRGVTWRVPGQFGDCGRFGGAANITVPNLAITREGTWAAWLRVAPDRDPQATMRVLDVNGTGFQVEGTEFAAFLYEETGTHYTRTTITAGRWVHMALTWGMDEGGRGSIRLYKDGVLQGQADYGGSPGFPVSTLKIGSSWDSIRYYQGDLDDVCVYRRRLAEDEIQELMNRGVAEWDRHARPAAAPGAGK